MALRPESRQPEELRPTFTLPNSIVISGKWKDLDTSTWKIVSKWGQELNLPAGDVQGVRFRGRKGHVPFRSHAREGRGSADFGHRFPWRHDVNLLGEPLKINGQGFDRGLAVHSRCILTYDLGRAILDLKRCGFRRRFSGQRSRRLPCFRRQQGDLLESRPLRHEPPIKLSLPIVGARQLRLHIDYGRGQDTGDRVIWAKLALWSGSKRPRSRPLRQALRRNWSLICSMAVVKKTFSIQLQSRLCS